MQVTLHSPAPMHVVTPLTPAWCIEPVASSASREQARRSQASTPLAAKSCNPHCPARRALQSISKEARLAGLRGHHGAAGGSSGAGRCSGGGQAAWKERRQMPSHSSSSPPSPQVPQKKLFQSICAQRARGPLSSLTILSTTLTQQGYP